MEKYNTSEIPKSSRITRLVDHLYAKMPEIESYRAKLITESYKETEDQPIITRRAKAFSHILHNIPIIIQPELQADILLKRKPDICSKLPEPLPVLEKQVRFRHLFAPPGE